MQKASLLFLLALGGCAGHPLAECRGPVWSANPTQAQPGVSDDGTSTFFHFPGHMRIPTIYAVLPDGKEAVVPWTMDTTARTVVVHQTAKEFRLRDGDNVLCLTNRHYDEVGPVIDAGTASVSDARMIR